MLLSTFTNHTFQKLLEQIKRTDHKTIREHIDYLIAIYCEHDIDPAKYPNVKLNQLLYRDIKKSEAKRGFQELCQELVSRQNHLT